MAQKVQFLGFKRVLTGAQMQDNYLYFVRDAGELEGKLWFNGVCYGSCRDTEIDKVLEALEGFIPASGEVTNVKEYIDEAIAQLESDVTTIELGDDSFSGLTLVEDSSTSGKLDYTLTLTNVAPDDEFRQEIADREAADEALEDKLEATAQTLSDAIEAEEQARQEEDAKLQAELNAVENSLGFSDTAYTQDGTYITGGTVAADIAILDEVLASYRSGSTEEIDKIEEAVGLAADGSYVDKSGTNYLDDADSVEGEIDALDKALKEVADRTVTEGQSTENYVALDVTTTSGATVITIDDSALKTAIEAMDLAEVHEAGKAIVAVSEEDGVVSATAGTVAAEYVDVADAAGKFTGSTVEEVLAEIDAAYKAADEAIVGDATESGNTLGKLEDRIEELASDAKEYHLVKVTTGLSAEIKEEYYLADAEGNQSGDTISVPKDSHIVEINYITDSGDPHYQNLEYVYIDVCGATKTEYVDMSQLILEQEFASGITSTDGVAHGVVDPASEGFLTVGADGFKLSGVQDAINAAVSAETEAREDADDAIESALTLTAQTLVEMIENAASAATTEVVEGTDAGNNLSIAESAGADGHKIYTLNLTDVASASALTQEISDREDADEALQDEIDAIERGVGLTTGGTWVAGDGKYTSGSTSAADAIDKLDDAIAASEDAWEEALAEEVSARTAADEALEEKLEATAQTLSDAIEDEVSARTAADEALDERLDVIEEKYITAVTVNGVDATVADNAADVTIQADDIELGEEVTGTTGGIHFDATANTQDVFQQIVDVLNQSVAGSYTGVTSTGNTISVTPTTNGNNIEFLKETASEATVEDGHLELAKNNSNEWYGVMYWIDEETA